MSRKPDEALKYVQAFVDIYERIDGPVDELSSRDFNLMNDYWDLHQSAKAYLTGQVDAGLGIFDSTPTGDGYGRCAGCGGQEPIEVLQQMDGYCSSGCERDHRED